MLRSLQTSESWPSFVRSRFTPPTRTPSVVESMNVVSVKSTTTSVPPWPITSSSCCLNSGAVYRSTSPVSEMTYASPLSCSVLMSKFMCGNPPKSSIRPRRADPGESIRAAGAAIPLAAGLVAAGVDLGLCLGGGLRLLELLDRRLHARDLRRARIELDELLPGRDRFLVAAGVLRGGRVQLLR